jgi:hypothetical protein
MGTNSHEAEILPALNTRLNGAGQGTPPISLEPLIRDLMESSALCQSRKDYDSAVAACQTAGIVWTAIHQQALHAPALISQDVLDEVRAGMMSCVQGVRGCGVKPVEAKLMTQYMDLRLELLTLLQTKGLSAVNERLKSLLIPQEHLVAA